VPRNGESATAEELIAFCKERMAPTSTREIEFVEVLPKTASGKILRRQLRDEEAGRAKE
jgi:acyl-coenzyme A synthetase/AMP-(fatty) acid ligase